MLFFSYLYMFLFFFFFLLWSYLLCNLCLRKSQDFTDLIKCRRRYNLGLKIVNVLFQEKNPFSPHGRSLELPTGRGILKFKILEAKYEAKLEFPGGGGGNGGCKTKNLLWGGGDNIFWNRTI